MTKDSKTLRKRLEKKFTNGIGVPTDDYDSEENYSEGFSDRTEDVLAFIEAELALAKKEAYEEGKQRGVEFAINVLVREGQPVPEDLMKHYSKFLSESPKDESL